MCLFRGTREELRGSQIQQLQDLVREQAEVEKEIAKEVERMEEEYRTLDRSERVVFDERVKRIGGSDA